MVILTAGIWVPIAENPIMKSLFDVPKEAIMGSGGCGVGQEFHLIRAFLRILRGCFQ